MTEFGCAAPEVLHPVSEQILWLFINGMMPEWEFIRLFSLPNSDYIELAACLVAQLS